jgi:hypothetical protein
LVTAGKGGSELEILRVAELRLFLRRVSAVRLLRGQS